MRSAWKALDFSSQDASIPPLLMKYELGLSNYTIWLTDLTTIWKESLDRRRIIQRAFSIDTSIDPSEDSDQMRVFLESIAKALEHREGTSVHLLRSDSEAQFALRILTPLPGPLKPLEWTIDFFPASQSTMTTEFIIPLLNQRRTAKVEQASLLQQVKEKDHVIARLTEKILSDGMDLAKVFPGAASSRYGTRPNARQEIGKTVRGLGEFNEEQWRSRLLKDDVGRDWRDIVSSDFDVDSAEYLEIARLSDSMNWWERLSDRGSQLSGSVSSLSGIDTGKELASQVDFQRQSTPSKFRSKSPNHAVRGINMNSNGNQTEKPKFRSDHNDSTTEESDDDRPSHVTKGLSPSGNTSVLDEHSISDDCARVPSKAERTKNRPEPPVKVYKNETSPQKRNGATTHNTASSTDEDAMDLDSDALAGFKKVSDDPPSETHFPPKSKPKLGKIGGKGKLGKLGNRSVSQGSQGGDKAIDNHERREDVISEAGDRNAQHSVLALTPQRSGRATVKPDPVSPPRETSQERANKKREQLKRELESKSQHTVKKKRRF